MATCIYAMYGVFIVGPSPHCCFGFLTDGQGWASANAVVFGECKLLDFSEAHRTDPSQICYMG